MAHAGEPADRAHAIGGASAATGTVASPGPSTRAASARRRRLLRWVIGLNLAFLGVELVVGWLTNSLAVFGDAAHMGTDVAALVLALAAEQLSAMPSGPRNTWGLRRAPTLAALANATTMVVLAVVLVFEAVQRLEAPPMIQAMPVFVVGVVGLAVNVGSAFVLHRGSSHSHNVRGAMLHMFGDALGSLAVLVSAGVIHATGWLAIDPLVTMLVAVAIVVASWPLLRDSVKTLLEASPRHVEVDAVRDELLAQDGVTCVEDLHAWELDHGDVVLTTIVHVTGEDLDGVEALRRRLRAHLVDRWGIGHVTLELVVEQEHPRLPDQWCVQEP